MASDEAVLWALQLAANDVQTFLAAGLINASVLVGPPAQALKPQGQ